MELTAHFIVDEHGNRELKDAMSRVIPGAVDEASIVFASGTYGIVGMPPLRVQKVVGITGDEKQ